MLLNGKTYRSPEEIGKALTECARFAEQGEQLHGAYRGMRILIQRINHKVKMSVSGFATMEFPLGVTTPEANEARLKSIRAAFLNEIPKHETVLAQERKDEQDCRDSYGKPFPKAAELPVGRSSIMLSWILCVVVGVAIGLGIVALAKRGKDHGAAAFISEDSTRLERRVDKAYDDLKRRFS